MFSEISFSRVDTSFITQLEETFNPTQTEPAKIAQEILNGFGDKLTEAYDKNIKKCGCLCVTGFLGYLGFGAGLISNMLFVQKASFWAISGYITGIFCSTLSAGGAYNTLNSLKPSYSKWKDKILTFHKEFEYFVEHPKRDLLLALFDSYQRVQDHKIVSCCSNPPKPIPSPLLLMEVAIACLKAKNVEVELVQAWENLLNSQLENNFCELNQQFWSALDLQVPPIEEYQILGSDTERKLLHIPNRVTNIFVKTIKENCDKPIFSCCSPSTCGSSPPSRHEYEAIN